MGPGLAGIIARVWSWRVVYLGLLPLVPCALWLILEPLTHIDAQAAPEPTSNRTRSAVQWPLELRYFWAPCSPGLRYTELSRPER